VKKEASGNLSSNARFSLWHLRRPAVSACILPRKSSYAVEGMDLLLYAFAMAEQNNTDKELEPVFDDIRGEISANLKKLLRNMPDPEPSELTEDEA